MLPVMPLAFEDWEQKNPQGFSAPNLVLRPPSPFAMLNMLLSKSKQCDGTSSSKNVAVYIHG